MYKTYTYGTHVYTERKYITYIYNLYTNINNFSIEHIYIYIYTNHIYTIPIYKTYIYMYKYRTHNI